MTFDLGSEYVSYSQPIVENPSMSPSMPTQYRSSESPWSQIGTPSSSVGQRLEEGARWDMEIQAHNREMPLQFLPEDVSDGNVIPLPHSSSSAEGEPNTSNVTLHSLAWRQGQSAKPVFRNIQAKPTLSSPSSIKVTEKSVVVTQGAKNITRIVGRRHGPLEAKIKEGANKVRKIRACAHCRTKKIRVS
jgi:hypothetical protein